MSNGDLIRAWRNYHRLSQQHLADLVGVTRVTIGNWESDKHQPQRAAWARFRKAWQKVDAERPCYTVSDQLRRVLLAPEPPLLAELLADVADVPGALDALGSFTLNTKGAGS